MHTIKLAFKTDSRQSNSSYEWARLLKALTCRAFAANLKTFSLSTSMISWETKTTMGGGTLSGCRECGSYGDKHRMPLCCPAITSTCSQNEPVCFSPFPQTVVFTFLASRVRKQCPAATVCRAEALQGSTDSESSGSRWEKEEGKKKKKKQPSRIVYHYFNPAGKHKRSTLTL